MYHDFVNYLLEAENEPPKDSSQGASPEQPKQPKPKRERKPSAPKKPRKKLSKMEWTTKLNQELHTKKESREQLVSILKLILGEHEYPYLIGKFGNDLIAMSRALLNKVNEVNNTPEKQFNTVRALVDELNKHKEFLMKDNTFSNSEISNVEYEQQPEEQVNTTPILKEWLPYEKFRKEMFALTVQLGWPDNIKPDPRAIQSTNTKEMSSEQKADLWETGSKTPYVFSNWGPDFLNKTSINLKTYLMNKFANSPEKLRALTTKVDQIVEHEKQFFKRDKGSIFLNIVGAMTMFVFKGLGGQDRDVAWLTWLKDRFKKMTIFEYQQSILTDISLRNNITDETSTLLKQMLNSTFFLVKQACGTNVKEIKNIRTERSGYEGSLTAYFDVVPNTNNARSDASLRQLFYELIHGFRRNKREVVVSTPEGILYKFAKNAVSSPRFTSGPSLKDLSALVKLYTEPGDKAKMKFDEQISEGLRYVWSNKNEKGEEIGEYIWHIRRVSSAIRFSLSYDVGEE